MTACAPAGSTGRRARHERSSRLLAFTAGAVAAGAALPAVAAIPTPPAAPVRDAAGKWPRDLFPSGQHPTDHHGPSIPDEPDDAALIAVCAEFDAIERHINSHYAGGSREIDDDEERDVAIAPFQEAQDPLLERIIALRATTPGGLKARARTLASWDQDAMRHIGPGHYLEDRMLAALLRDMMGAPA